MNTSLSATSPAPGRTMTGMVRPWRRRFQEIVAAVEPLVSPELAAELSSALGLPATCNGSSSPHRVARVAVSLWLVCANRRLICYEGSVGDALRLFVEPAAEAFVPNITLPDRTALALAHDDSLLDMLPYMLDVHGEGTRLSVMRDPSDGRHRFARKQAGSYLTPSDVAAYMVSRVLPSDPGARDPATLIDPACGTGVFLRAGLRALSARGYPASTSATCLFGVDTCAEAVDACRVVLLNEALRLEDCADSKTLWAQFGRQLVVRDSLRMVDAAANEAGSPWPGQSWPAGWPLEFSALVGNPPYAPLGAREDLTVLARTFSSLRSATPATNAYLAFMEMMWLLVAGTGRSCLVVPMSVAYSTTRAARLLRDAMTEVDGAWDLAFFDRTPDALFGDDVKQRNAIVLLQRGAKRELRTGPVLRWTSRTRSGLFDRIPSVSLGDASITDGVPKLGTQLERVAYDTLRRLPRCQPDETVFRRVTLGDANPNSDSVFVAGTAYNWLSVYRSIEWARDLETPSSSPLTAFVCSSSQLADATYAVASSKLAYWLWRVESDCFHVPTAFLRSLPAPSWLRGFAVEELARVGRELWSSIRNTPVRSVNRGRTTVTFSPWALWDLVQTIDALLIDALGLPAGLDAILAALVERNVVVDPSDRSRVAKGNRMHEWRSA